MKRVFGFAVVVLFASWACTKTSDPILTSDQIYVKDSITIDKYLADNNITAVYAGHGVRYVIDELGTGATVTKDNCIRFYYAVHSIEADTAFEKSDTSGYKAGFKNLTSGIQVGLKQMPVGTKGKIFVPSKYGYPNGVYDSEKRQYKLNPNTPIWFEVEVKQLYDYNTLGNYCYE